MHAGFYLLLAASAAQYAARHGLTDRAPLVLAVAGVLALVYSAGMLFPLPRKAWVIALLVVWLPLVFLAPSFGWCAVPVLFAALGEFSARTAIVLAVALTASVILAGLLRATTIDPSLILAPVAVTVIATAAFVQLAKARDELAVSQREAGVLAERQRLARDIHDTIAQGLSSVNLLLQAADRDWESAPERSRSYVRQAAGAARDNLAEARGVVAGLTPAALTEQPLTEALRELCQSTGAEFSSHGTPVALSTKTSVELLRIAQSALANVAEHAQATQTLVTLTFEPTTVRLEIADNGIGFDPSAPRPGAGRGYGLEAMRDRAALIGGTLTVRSGGSLSTLIMVEAPK